MPLTPELQAAMDAEITAELDAFQADWGKALRKHLDAVDGEAAQTSVQLAREDDDAAVEKLIAAGGAAVALLAAAYRAGEITKAQFIERATERLSGNAEAAGRRGAAQYGDPSDFDLDALDGISDRVDTFADTVADDGNSDAQVAAWAMGLAGIGWAVYQGARRDGGIAAGIDEWDWTLDPDASHCDDCIALADDSPYPEALKPGNPGDGGTQCGGRCRCKWEPHEE